jgi:hypothetical protein
MPAILLMLLIISAINVILLAVLPVKHYTLVQYAMPLIIGDLLREEFVCSALLLAYVMDMSYQK